MRVDGYKANKKDKSVKFKSGIEKKKAPTFEELMDVKLRGKPKMSRVGQAV